jgi:hypothetical protein
MVNCSKCKKEFETNKKTLKDNYKTCLSCRKKDKEYGEKMQRTYNQREFSSKDNNSKTCNNCLETKKLEMFYTHRRYKDGHRTACISCHSVKWKEYYHKTYHDVLKEKLNNDYTYRLKQNVKSYIHIHLKKHDSRKKCRSSKYIGCEIPSLVNWLVWLNPKYGGKNSDLQIDHVIPLSLFDLNIQEEIDSAFNWTNLQVLEKKENLKKYNNFSPIEFWNHILIVHRYLDKTSKNFKPLKNLINIMKKHHFCNTSKLRGPP